MKREFSAGGLVFHKNKETEVLLIKDHAGRWSLPKGHIEKGETTKETALREVSEETGLKKLKIITRLGEIKYFFQLKGEKIFKIVVFFLMEAEDTKLKVQWEIQDAKWFPVEEIREMIGYKNQKNIIENAIKFLKEKV